MIISFKPLLSFSEIQAEGGKKEGMISSSEKHILLPAPSHPFPCQGYLALSAGTVCSEEERKSPPALRPLPPPSFSSPCTEEKAIKRESCDCLCLWYCREGSWTAPIMRCGIITQNLRST